MNEFPYSKTLEKVRNKACLNIDTQEIFKILKRVLSAYLGSDSWPRLTACPVMLVLVGSPS